MPLNGLQALADNADVGLALDEDHRASGVGREGWSAAIILLRSVVVDSAWR